MFRTEVQDRCFVGYSLAELEPEILWAKQTAHLKTVNTVNSWQQRSVAKRFTNIFQGDLAKNIVAKIIREQAPQAKLILISVESQFEISCHATFAEHAGAMSTTGA